MHRDDGEEVDAPLLAHELEQPIEQRGGVSRRGPLGAQGEDLVRDGVRARPQLAFPPPRDVQGRLFEHRRVGVPRRLELVLVGPAAGMDHRVEAAERRAQLAGGCLDAETHRPEPDVR